MNNRPIDRGKKSNIKCEHCMYCDKVKDYGEQYYCILHIKKVKYWNRCKDFKWKESKGGNT